ncbi:abc transporter family protein [Stylonychia lemnae]|uniref:Abc transporter family protein n=1 Tax=Stylonychia lemnae TaxID=5949 RepID=A0A078AG75_STYLE|nr:abc transporter family protein [Stylonychia lemnae]|eukprot:CDW79863.1 abc transporter family protein [Stylonychia lemnae]
MNQGKPIQKDILKDVSGYALPGEVLYLIGSSGSGKTSLLNVICDRIIPNRNVKLQKNVIINDRKELDSRSFSKLGAYVMQDDIIFDFFTPKEALRFACRLKLKVDKATQDQLILKLLDELGLNNVQNTRIGGRRKKLLSGGEMKRVAIGIALITDPLLLILDEPTSGIDSFRAMKIVKLLKRQAEKGKTVIATIHQPSTEAFRLFDRILLMTDGLVIYEGVPPHSLKYFKSIGFPCPKYSNPSDYYMSNILTVDYPKTEKFERKLQFLLDNYQTYIVPLVLEAEGSVILNDVDRDIMTQVTSIREQFRQLIGREILGQIRNPQHLRVKVARQIIVGLLILAVFFGLDGNNAQDIKGLSGCLFFIAVNQTMMYLFSSLIVFQEERPLFLREYSEKMYRLIPYFLTKVIVDIPLGILQAIIFSIVVYFGIGVIVNAWLFFRFLFVVLLIGFTGNVGGYFISSLFRQTETAVLFVPVFLMPLILLGGFFANIGKTQRWIVWMQYLSPIRFGSEALLQNEFSSRTDIPPAANPLNIFNYNLGYWLSMVLLVCLAIVLMICGMIFLKFFISRPQ